MNYHMLVSRFLVFVLAVAGLVLVGFAQPATVWADEGSQVHTAVGIVKETDTAERTVTLAHGAVESLGWPAMTMKFQVADKQLLENLSKGKTVEFDIVKRGNAYVIVDVR